MTGSLIITGTGIVSVAHITLETEHYLKTADIVFFLVFDPVIQAYILSKNQSAIDLAEYYDDGKTRYDAHLEMSEVIVKEVRAGKKVVASIYGHPVITTSPAHRACAIARQEGYEVKILPGVSAADNMLANLGIDPTLSGYATCEANELIAHGRQLNTNVNNIILNIGNVGERENNSLFSLLIDYLEAEYGRDHRVLHYLAENLPQSSTAMVAYTIEELRVDAMVSWIRPTSAIYIPPLQAQDFTAINLGLPDIALRYLSGIVQLEETLQGARPVTHIDYGPYVDEARARLLQHAAPRNYKSLRASPAMRQLMIDLSIDSGLKERYKASPKSRNEVISEVTGLTETEKIALRMGQAGPVVAVMLRTTDVEPTELELEELGRKHGGDSPHPIIAT